MQISTQIYNLKNYKIYLKIAKLVSEFLDRTGYLRVDLPVLSPTLIPESYLEIFETEFKYLGKKEKLFLTPSPELFLKRLIAQGVSSCYYLGKSFRNEELSSSLHSFEFTMLEYYKVGANYMELADELLEMINYINNKLKNTGKTAKLKYRNYDISLDRWEKTSVVEAFKKYAEITEEELFDQNKFITKAKNKGYHVEGFSYEDLWSQIYTAEVEPHLGTNGFPTLIYDYPKPFAALAKLNQDKRTAQRFEFYIAGVELGDCYTELIDWREQQLRFKNEQLKRKEAKKTSHSIDKGFIETLKYGLPKCSGIAIGLERLAMIFSNIDSIQKLKLINIE